MALEATDSSLEKKLSPAERAKVAEWSERILEEGQPKFKQAQKEKELEPDTDKHPLLALSVQRASLLVQRLEGVFQLIVLIFSTGKHVVEEGDYLRRCEAKAHFTRCGIEQSRDGVSP